MKKTLFAALAIACSATAIADVPALKITAACDACALPEDVAKSMQDGYAKALGSPAAYAGEIEVSVTEYNARGGAARVMLGVLAGKDKIVAAVNLAGGAVKVEDTARSGLCGIGCVASNVGGKIAEAVAPEQVKAQREAATQYQERARLILVLARGE